MVTVTLKFSDFGEIAALPPEQHTPTGSIFNFP